MKILSSMKKIKLILCALIAISTDMQAHYNDNSFGLKTALVITGTTITGVTIWRMTAPSDETVLHQINSCVMTHEGNLQKYNQQFNTNNRQGEQETQLIENLIEKLQYQDQYQDRINIQKELSDHARILNNLKNSIWFRSLFSPIVACKYQELKYLEANATQLKTYFMEHDKFFAGWKLYQEYDLLKKMESYDINHFVYSIKGQYLLSTSYPLISFTTKIINDLKWIDNLKKGVYPILDRHLQEIKEFGTRTCIGIQAHFEYKDEIKTQYEELERQRLQALAQAELLKAQAALATAQAAQQQANAATKNAQIEQARLKLEQEENERKRIEARIQELARLGYSPEQIQAQLDFEGFTKALINLFFGQ